MEGKWFHREKRSRTVLCATVHERTITLDSQIERLRELPQFVDNSDGSRLLFLVHLPTTSVSPANQILGSSGQHAVQDSAELFKSLDVDEFIRYMRIFTRPKYHRLYASNLIEVH